MKNLIWIIALITTIARADDSLSTKIHEQYTSFRAMGMGNAFTAVADDYSLMFYNPAGYAKKRYNEVQFTLAGVGYSPKTQTLMDDIKKATETGTESQKAAAVSAVLDQYYGKSLGGSVQAVEIFWTRKNWGVALLPANLTIDMSFNRQLGPAIDLNVIGDTTIAYGYGTDINKFIAAGATLKYVHRVSVDQSVSALELASDPNVLSTNRFKEGTSLDMDIGFLWTPDWFNSATTKTEVEIKPEPEPEIKTEEKRTIQSEIPSPVIIPSDDNPPPESTVAEKIEEATTIIKSEPVQPTTAPPVEVKVEAPVVEKIEIRPKLKPKLKHKVIAETTKETSVTSERFPLTFGLVIKNIAGGSFIKSQLVNKDATEVPSKMNTTLDLGSQYQLAKFGELTFRTMLDFKNLFHPDITLTKAFHAGVEADYYPNSWFKTQLRAGLNQNYYTAGVTLLLGIIHIDALTYGEEVGTNTTKIENRVYAAKLGFNF